MRSVVDHVAPVEDYEQVGAETARLRQRVWSE